MFHHDVLKASGTTLPVNASIRHLKTEIDEPSGLVIHDN
jgi:hypothetical protein